MMKDRIMTNRTPSALVLEDGTIYRGLAIGAEGTTFGEAVFSTEMTGYQETMTNPANHGRIVVMTAPHIGNTGWNDEDSASRDGKIWAAGLAIRDLSHTVSNWRADHSLTEALTAQDTVGIQAVDTRAIVRHLRNNGPMKAGIFAGDALVDDETMVAEVNNQPNISETSLIDEVTTGTTYTVEAEGETEYTVIAYDLGVAKTTPQAFAKHGVRTVVVPAETSFEEIQNLRKENNAQGIFFSDGPGDPKNASQVIGQVKKILDADIPLFASGLGHQVFGRALGLETYQLAHGHHGSNIPVKKLATGTVGITSHNHGFAVKNPVDGGDQNFDTPFGPAKITHVCLNDNVVEGLALENNRAFSVQYQPESATQPHGENPLIDHFLTLLEREK